MILLDLNDYLASITYPEQDKSFLPQYAQTEVFFSLKTSSENPDEPALPLQMELVQSEIGPAVLLFTSAKDTRLSAPFAGISLFKAMEMVRKIPQVQGLILQSSATSCVQLNQAALQALLEVPLEG